MNLDKVLNFYRCAISEGKISTDILSQAKTISSEFELKRFMEEKLLPIAEEMGYAITLEDLMEYEKIQLNALVKKNWKV